MVRSKLRRILESECALLVEKVSIYRNENNGLRGLCGRDERRLSPSNTLAQPRLAISLPGIALRQCQPDVLCQDSLF